MDTTDHLSEPEGFSISELCALLGVTPSAIRKYEQMTDLPVRRYKNGYRYFYLNDLQSLLHMRALERLGYSVREAGGLSIGADYEEKLEAGQRHLEHSREEIKLRHLRLEYEEELLERLRRLEQEDGRFIKAIRPAFWWMTCTREFMPDKAKALQAWIECIPFAEPGVRIQDGVFETGFCVRERWGQVLSEAMRSQAVFYPSVPCIRTILHADKDTEPEELDEELAAYFDENALEPTGDDFALLLASSLRTPWRPERAFDYYVSWTAYTEKY